MHGRTQIRQAVVAALSGLATPVSVLDEPHRRLSVDDLPAVLIGVTDDAPQSDMRAMGAPLYDVERQQTVSIEIHAAGDAGSSIADQIDQIDLEVEQALANDAPLQALAEILESSDSTIEWSDDQDTILAARTSNYIVTWRHAFGAPDVPEG